MGVTMDEKIQNNELQDPSLEDVSGGVTASGLKAGLKYGTKIPSTPAKSIEELEREEAEKRKKEAGL